MNFLYELWNITQEAAPYLILGLLFAGIIKTFLKDEFIQKHLGENNFISVLKASLFGVPLPLCSCGVIPTAVSLRKQGASKSATTAFLISTPESGADSIAISYALLDPVLTVIRPVAGFVTAMIAGMIETFFPEEKMEEPEVKSCCSTSTEEIKEEVIEPITNSGLIQISGLTKKSEPAPSCCTVKEEPKIESCCSTEKSEPKESIFSRLKEGLRYSFVNLMEDIAYTLSIGLILAAAISYFIPETFFTQFLSNPFLSMIAMLLIGVPMYICATASTPIAAALIMKGLSPGAAIVFLIAGPATNLAALTVLRKILGASTVVRYLASIVIMSLVFGLITNFIYDAWNIPIVMMSATAEHSWLHTSGVGTGLTFVFLIVLASGLWNGKIKELRK